MPVEFDHLTGEEGNIGIGHSQRVPRPVGTLTDCLAGEYYLQQTAATAGWSANKASPLNLNSNLSISVSFGQCIFRYLCAAYARGSRLRQNLSTCDLHFNISHTN